MSTSEEHAAKAAYMRDYNLRNPEKKSRYHREASERRKADPDLAAKYREQRKLAARRQRGARVDLRIKEALRSRVRVAIHGYKRGSRKAGGAISDLGCTVGELLQHLEKQFLSGMTWDNYGEWHIDHIKPLSLFDLTDRQQFIEAARYENLQPMWAGDNQSKGNKWEG